MRVRLHPDAEEELFQAAAWYDDQRSGLGDDLVAEMTKWLEVIAEEPTMWPRWPEGPKLIPPVQRVLTDRFPYAIAYQVFAEHVAVLAFAHTSRRPFYWSGRTGR